MKSGYTNIFKSKPVWNLVFFLFLGVLATSIVLCSLNATYSFAKKPDGVVSVNPFTSYDKDKVWGNHTKIKLFRTSYANKDGELTVISSNGDQVVAPGTSNSFLFHISNNVNLAVDYTMEVVVHINNENTEEMKIPLKVRMYDESGKWLLGSETEYADFGDLNNVYKKAVLGGNSYSALTLEWEWPFEGEDVYDTELGDMQSGITIDEKDINLNVDMEIVITAEYDKDPTKLGGIQTGDNSRIGVYLTAMIVSLAGICFLLLFRRQKKDSKEDLA